jgi:hypothetical protein
MKNQCLNQDWEIFNLKNSRLAHAYYKCLETAAPDNHQSMYLMSKKHDNIIVTSCKTCSHELMAFKLQGV